jgi:hypothetical protein
MSVLNSLVGKTNAARQLDFLSIDTDSGIIDDGSSMQSIQACMYTLLQIPMVLPQGLANFCRLICSR